MTSSHEAGRRRLAFDVTVEVPKGSRNKYEIDHQTGSIRLDRQLFTATRYPADYGFIAGTLAEDGDPLDALVILDEPTFPGCHIACRAVAILLMGDEKGADAKILAVPAGDVRVSWEDLEDVPEHLRLELSHFFEIYKDLEPGKTTEVRDWDGRAAAETEIRRSRDRFAGR